MTHLRRKALLLLSCLLLAVPTLATPSLEREAQLEAEERLELKSDEFKVTLEGLLQRMKNISIMFPLMTW